MHYEIGAKVIHPAYGPGRIIAIKEKQFNQQVNRYYMIHMPAQRMTVMVPVQSADDLGLRPISKPVALEEMWQVLEATSKDLNSDWKLRKNDLTEQIHTGDILQVAEAIRDLTGRRQEQPLSQTDRELLDQAEMFLAAELALARDIELSEALSLIHARMQPGEGA